LKRLLARLIPARFRSNAVEIPVVRLSGAVMAGGSQFRPALNLASISPLLEKAFADKEAPAVAFSVNSPGGSPVQARLIYKRIRDLAVEKNKTVFMFLEDVAASGGYMIAVAGDEIIADPSSIVGSIGVISASFGFTGLMEKIGVERRIHTAGSNKSVLDPFSPEKEKDIAHLKALQLDIHDVFISMVKERRGAKLKDNPDLFTGLFWAGQKAKDLGLVDELGDMRSFLKARYGEKTKLRLIAQSRGLFGMRAGAGGVSRIGAGAAEALIDSAEERALWARFGL
jgi:signal peptide peptidase SppA